MLQDRDTNSNAIIVVLVVMLATPVFAGNFYQLQPLTYFDVVKKKKDREKVEIDWREPILGPDGRGSFYRPPKPVRDLLDDPTPQNARKYVRWQREKMRRIIKAQKALKAESDLSQGSSP